MAAKVSRNAIRLMLFMVCVLDVKAQTTSQSPSVDVLLDVSAPEKAKAAMDDAISARRYDLLFLAMHNKSDEVEMACLDKIHTLARPTQAMLLSRILHDESILRRADLTYAGGTEDVDSQINLQTKLQEMSYDVLQQSRPIKRYYLSRHDAIKLADELDKVK